MLVDRLRSYISQDYPTMNKSVLLLVHCWMRIRAMR